MKIFKIYLLLLALLAQVSWAQIAPGMQVHMADLSSMAIKARVCNALTTLVRQNPGYSVPPGTLVNSVYASIGLPQDPDKMRAMDNWISQARGYVSSNPGRLEADCAEKAELWFATSLSGAFDGRLSRMEAATGHLGGIGGAIAAVSTSGINSDVLTTCELSDEELNQCLIRESSEFEIDATGILSVLNEEFNISPSSSGPTELQKCSCLRSRINNRFPDASTREREIRNARNSLSTMVIQSAGKKFMDALASNFEDVNYFKTTPGGSQRFSSLYCTNPQDFAASLGDSCGVPQSEKQQRLSHVFNSFGFLSNEHTIDGLMRDFSSRVNAFTPEGANEPYTRDQHDVRRFSLSNEDKTFVTINSALSRMLSTPAISQRISQNLTVASYRSPQDAILEVLKREIESTNALPSYFDISGMEEEDKNNITNALAARDYAEVQRLISLKISYAMTIHPGLSRMLADRDTFARIRTRLPATMPSLKGFLESQPDLMAGEFTSECNRLKAELTQLICTPTDQLLSNVPPGELRDIAKASQADTNIRDMHAYLMCQNPNQQNLPAFTNILQGNYSPSKNSDFQSLVNPDGDSSAAEIIYALEQGNEKVRDEISVAVIATEQNNRGWADHISNRFHGDRGGRISDRTIADVMERSGRPVLSNIASSQNIVRNPINNLAGESSNNEGAERVLASLPSGESRILNTNGFSTPQGAYSNTRTPASANDESSRESREESFRRRFSEEEVARMRQDLTPEQRSELERLKQEALLSRQRLDELTSQNQLAKIQNLQEEVRLLEERRNNVRDRRDSELEEVSSNSDSDRSAARSIASGSETNNPSASSLNGANSGGNLSGPFPGNTGSRGSVTSAASGTNPPAVLAPKTGSQATGAIVITSARTTNRELAPGELSEEVIQYLNESNPDLNVLTQIKEKGMLYRYKTVVNGREQEKEVFIKYDLLSPEAKRMVESRIASQLNNELKERKRSYSYEALKFIVGQEIISQRR